MKLNPLLLIDYYKTTHHDQYPAGIEKLTSYFTPRMSRLPFENKIVMFGLQGFIKEFLIDAFNENFFNRDLEDVLSEYSRILDNTLGKDSYDLNKIKELHDLGYLPLEINAVPEGTKVPMGVPMFEITNTHPKFAWLVNTVESLMSAELWHSMMSATVGTWYKDIVNKYYDISVSDTIKRETALGDFSFRGQESVASAIKSSAGWLLSFYNTATVPVIMYLEKYYNCDCTKEVVGRGSISTEHSVMCSNTAVDGDEITFVKRLLTETYKNQSFSMVSDSYDYWNLVDNILPQLKEEIMNHNGTILIRGDSGDPVEVVTKTVFKLWDTFGGSVNEKGYKVLDPHIKAIYGDSITIQRARKIFQVLIDNGFACNNVALGVGSFSMQCVELEDGTLSPFTRDTFGIAVKATYCVVNGKEYQIFKNPKEGGFKKSHKGLVWVGRKIQGELFYEDNLSEKDRNELNSNLKSYSLFRNIFKDGKMTKEYSLNEIREIINTGV